MSDFHLSVADSTPRAQRGQVIKVKKEPVSLELGNIVLDKEEVRIKDILAEMNLIANVSQIGTTSEDTSSGGIGNGFKGLNQMFDLFKKVKEIVSKIANGNKKQKPNNQTSQEEEKVVVGLDLLEVLEDIPKFNQDPLHDDFILVLIADFINKNVEKPADPLGEFLKDMASWFIELNSYMDAEFSKPEKLRSLKNLGIHDFFLRLKADVEPYIKASEMITGSLNQQIVDSSNELIAKIKATDQHIETELGIENDTIEYNKRLRESRDRYKQYMIEEELSRLEANPKEEQLIYKSEYDKQLDLLRQSRGE